MLTVRNRIISYVFELAKTTNAFDVLEKRTEAFTQDELVEALLECGVIPEAFAHDSSEEKLWAKYCDILLAHAFNALGLQATVLQVRGNSADVFAKEASYTLVADAKAFRLSRTAKNQKDFKITALDNWRRQDTYACLAGPLTQFPTTQSQIYQQAVHKNVTLISYTHLRFLIEHQVTGSLQPLWDIGRNLTTSGRASEYWMAVDNVVVDLAKQTLAELATTKQLEIDKLKELGNEGIAYWKDRVKVYQALSKEEAITQLIKAEKLEAKIKTIERAIAWQKI